MELPKLMRWNYLRRLPWATMKSTSRIQCSSGWWLGWLHEVSPLLPQSYDLGCSFRQIEHLIYDVKMETGVMQLGYVQDWTVANYARLVCALNRQNLSDVLRRDSTWAFALANDASTHHGKSYFDNRVRLHLGRRYRYLTDTRAKTCSISSLAFWTSYVRTGVQSLSLWVRWGYFDDGKIEWRPYLWSPC